ncbi:MAG: xanthine dehydrogenase family protein subunit M [Rhodobacteraceae bacterium]|nr:xanthine dehydrogenase family protein subunit M [Paracoccaceae bacterium]
MFGEFDLEMPKGLSEALDFLSDGKGGAVLSGGTNLMIDLRSRKERPDRVISLEGLDELRGISTNGDRITLGSRTTISDMLRSDKVADFGPSLIDAAGRFAGQMVRNAGTVGGNVGCSSPAADLVPPLMSLDAEVALISASGSRTVALRDYYQGYKQDVRKADELIASVSWARPPANSVNSFYKLARRIGDAITVTGIAVCLSVEDGKCQAARIALGAVAPTVIRAAKAEAMLQGQSLTDELIAAAAKQAREECSPIDDVRATAEYRRHTVEMLTRRLVTQAWDKLT